MKKLLAFVLILFSLTLQAQMVQLGGGGGGLDGSSGGGGGGGGGAGSIAVWAPATAYALDDIAIYNDTIFIRIIAGTTATGPDQDITNWTPVGLNALPQHIAATYYHVGQVVEHNGLLYRRLVAGISAGTPDVDGVNWQSQQIELSSQVTGILGQANGGTGFDFSSLANGEIFIGNGAGFVSASLTGTLNQVAVANGAGSITLSTPQDIHSGASPTFVSASFTGLTASEYVKTDGASGLTTVASIPFSDLTGIVPVDQGGTGFDASSFANGELLIGNGSGYSSATVTGTLNQVAVANGAGSITLSTPQDIHVGASPTFVSATFSGALANEYLKTDGASGITTVASIPLSDLTGILPQAQGGTGSDFTSMANGEIFIGNGTGFVSASVTGTLNQVAVTNGAGSITLSTPQDIHSGATPTFVSASFSGLTPSQPLRTDGASGLTTGATDLTSEVSGILPNANGGTGLDTSTASNGTFLIGNGSGFDLNVVSGTANQVIATPSAGGLTLSTPQDIHVGATPTFVSATFSGLLPSEFVKTDASSGLTTAASIDFGDLTGIVPQDQGGTGVDASTLANGEIFIGNGAGFVSSTITGTLNQVAVTNGAGSITLSTPQDIHTGASPTFVGATLSGLTLGSVPFAGAGGVITQDNGDFFYDVGTGELGLGTPGPSAHLDINGISDIVQLEVEANGTQTNNIFEVTSANGGTDYLVVQGDSFVAVGDGAALKELHVFGGTQVDLPGDDNFFIDGSSAPRTTAVGALGQDHTAGIAGTSAYLLNVDPAGFDNTAGIRSTIDLAGETNSISSYAIHSDADITGMQNVKLHFYHAEVTGVEGAGSEVVALHVAHNLDVIKHDSSQPADSDVSFIDDGGFVDVTTEFASTGSDVQMFANDDAYIYVSNISEFNAVEVALSIVANQDINAIFEYSQGGATWNTLPVADGTSGFQTSGTISFDPPADWAVDSVNGSANRFFVRIQRTRNALATPPTESLIQVTPDTIFSWDEDGNLSVKTINTMSGLVHTNMTTAERDLLTPTSGQTIFNTTISQLQYYNGTGWISY